MVSEGRIEIEHDVVLVNEWRNQLIAHAEIDSQPGRNLPIVLEEVPLLPVVYVHGGPGLRDVRDSSGRKPE